MGCPHPRANEGKGAEMSFSLKPLAEQTIVLTGASSGIGLTTARALDEHGATLVLVSRNQEALDVLAEECRAKGGRALAIRADVGRNEDMERVAQLTLETFGGFDTWINNAGVAIYGTCEQVPLEDQRRLFDTNYWGVVYGSLIAAKHLRERGGKIINTGSVLSDRAVILQGPYSASTPSERNRLVGCTGPLLLGWGEGRSGMTWRISRWPSPTMMRSMTSCKIACLSANVASFRRA